MDVSIGIMAYNEEKNIGFLLKDILDQKLDQVSIKEIIIVSSKSTDNTDKIVKKLSKEDKKIILITQKERKGKYSAINIFLKKARSKNLVLCSADLRLKKDSIERLCLPLKKKEMGIVSSRPIPISPKKGFLGYVVNLQWHLHHKISLKTPKFGEMIAFKRLFTNIRPTAVDEEYIAMIIIKSLNMKSYYAKDSIIYNKGPETIKDLIKQRRRIYAGHLELKYRYNYKTTTMDKLTIVKKLLTTKLLNITTIHFFIFSILLELYCRFLGWYDLKIKKDHHYIWKISRSTK